MFTYAHLSIGSPFIEAELCCLLPPYGYEYIKTPMFVSQNTAGKAKGAEE